MRISAASTARLGVPWHRDMCLCSHRKPRCRADDGQGGSGAFTPGPSANVQGCTAATLRPVESVVKGINRRGSRRWTRSAPRSVGAKKCPPEAGQVERLSHILKGKGAKPLSIARVCLEASERQDKRRPALVSHRSLGATTTGGCARNSWIFATSKLARLGVRDSRAMCWCSHRKPR